MHAAVKVAKHVLGACATETHTVCARTLLLLFLLCGCTRNGEFSNVPAETLLEDLLGNVRVEGRQRIVEQYDVGIGVHGTCDGDALLLPA